jgi:hypothetical protein
LILRHLRHGFYRSERKLFDKNVLSIFTTPPGSLKRC